MRKIFFFITILAPLYTFAQTSLTFDLTGKIANATPQGKIYIIYSVGANQTVDSSAISLGSFSIHGTILNPVPATLIFDHTGLGLGRITPQNADAIQLYLEQGNIIVTALDSVSKAKITGSKLNDENQGLMSQLNVLRDKAKKIQADGLKATAAEQKSPEFQSNMQSRYKDLQNEQAKILQTFVISHPKSYISLLAISSLGGPGADPSILEPLYKSLDPELKNTETGKQLLNSIQLSKLTAIGTLAPDFTQNDADGKPVKLSSFRGKYVLIDFWASWCGPCRQENPNVVKAYNLYKNKNFTILGVSLDRPGAKEAWQAAVKSDGLNWTQVSDLKFWQNEAAALYKVSSIPQNFLLDPQGKIIAKNLRGRDLENKLREIFGAPTPVKSE